MKERRRFIGSCVSQDDSAAMVMHRVDFEELTDGKWEQRQVYLMATDPMSAVQQVQKGMAA